MYVDGFIVPVPKKKLGEYTEFSKKASEMWMKRGALSYVECVGDDVQPGEVTSFPQAVKLKDDEVVVFSWMEWPSREARDKGWDAAQKDPRMKAMDMPFDGKRMIYGGFAPLLDQ